MTSTVTRQLTRLAFRTGGSNRLFFNGLDGVLIQAISNRMAAWISTGTSAIPDFRKNMRSRGRSMLYEYMTLTSAVPRLTLLSLLIAVVAPGWSQPTITGIVNVASFDTAVPRGCLISIFGTNLARTPASASSVPLPTQLEETTVLVGDLELPAPLYFVSPDQVNAQLPFEALGNTLAIVISTSVGRSKPFLLKPAAAGPGLFTRDSSGTGPVLALTPDFRPLDAVTSGQSMILYATGLGTTDPPVRSGNPGAGQEPLNRVTALPEVYAGEYPLPLPIAFAGLAPGLAGVYQLNVTPQLRTTRGKRHRLAERSCSFSRPARTA